MGPAPGLKPVATVGFTTASGATHWEAPLGTGPVVVHPARSDPGAPAIGRLVQEDVGVRVADRAVTVVGQHDVDVVREFPAALIGDYRVEDGVVTEAAVRRDRPGRTLAAGRAVGATVDAAGEVDVVERVDARGWREGLAAVC